MNASTYSPARVVQPGQHHAAAAAIAAGHAEYPAFRHLFPDSRRRARALRSFFTATVRDAIAYGNVLTVWQGPQAAATAVWLPPGAFPWSPRRKLVATGALTRVLLTEPTRFRAFMRSGANLERAHPTEPHWYLVVLSVRPEHQRHGLGSRLVTPILERADHDGLPCYLETADPANIPFYQRHGFHVLDDALAAIPDGPTHTTMRREPALANTM